MNFMVDTKISKEYYYMVFGCELLDLFEEVSFSFHRFNTVNSSSVPQLILLTKFF